MTRTTACLVAAGLLVTATAGTAAEPADGSGFEVIDQRAVSVIPGLRAVVVRDPAHRSCYRIFVNEPSTRGGGGRVPLPDLDQAADTRDRQLAELLHSYDLDRGAIPGTIAPNPFRYEWQAESVQMQFALTVIVRAIQHLEQRLDQLPDSPGGAVAVIPESCPAAPREPVDPKGTSGSTGR